jgi:hypothetical protein
VKTSEPWFYGKAILCLEDVGGLSYNNCVQQLPCEWFYEGENCQVFPLPAGNLAPLTMGAPYQMDYSTNADCTHFVSPVSRELLRGCLETKPLCEKRLCHIQGKAKNGLTGYSVS